MHDHTQTVTLIAVLKHLSPGKFKIALKDRNAWNVGFTLYIYNKKGNAEVLNVQILSQCTLFSYWQYTVFSGKFPSHLENKG